MPSNLAADALPGQQGLYAGADALELKTFNLRAYDPMRPPRQRARTDGLFPFGGRENVLSLTRQSLQIARCERHQGNLMRARPLAGPAFAVKERHGVVANIRPLQSDELLNSLATSQQLQPQRCHSMPAS